MHMARRAAAWAAWAAWICSTPGFAGYSQRRAGFGPLSFVVRPHRLRTFCAQTSRHGHAAARRFTYRRADPPRIGLQDSRSPASAGIASRSVLVLRRKSRAVPPTGRRSAEVEVPEALLALQTLRGRC